MNDRSRLAIIGHVHSTKSNLTSILLAVAAAGVLHNSPPAVMPTRRPEFEVGCDLNDTLDDAGRRAERNRRKLERRDRMMRIQRSAVEGF
jgi:hypothetical protein